MPHRCIREYDIKRLLSRHLAPTGGVEADCPALLVDSHSNLRLVLQSQPWLRRAGARFTCAPDVLVPARALASHAAAALDATQLLRFLDRHVGTAAALEVAPHTRGTLSHFTVSPHVAPATPADVYALTLESVRHGIAVAFDRAAEPPRPPRPPRFRLCVPIDGNVYAMRVAEELVVPAGVAPDRVSDVADYICAVVRFFDDLEFTTLHLEPLVLIAPDSSSDGSCSCSASCSNSPASSSPVPSPVDSFATATATTTSATSSSSSPVLAGVSGVSGTSGSPSAGSPGARSRHVLMPRAGVRIQPDGLCIASGATTALPSPPASPLMRTSSPRPAFLSPSQQQQGQQQQGQQQQQCHHGIKRACMVPVHAEGALDYFAEYRQAERWDGVEFPEPWGHAVCAEERAIDQLNRAVPPALQNTGTSSTLQLTVLNPAGRVWFIASGAGSAMIYADTVIANGMGHELANYCEYSGHATEDQTYQLCRAVLLQATAAVPGRRAGRVLLLGGCIANYADVSRSLKGFDHAIREFRQPILDCAMLILVRRAGPNYHAALRTMHLCRAETGLDIRAYGPEVCIPSAVAMGVQYIRQFDATHAPDPSALEPLLSASPPDEPPPPPPTSSSSSSPLPSCP